MNVCSIIIAVIIAARVGSGLGTIMRIERRLTKRDMLSVFSRVPFFWNIRLLYMDKRIFERFN